jgi:hypothetical protein
MSSIMKRIRLQTARSASEGTGSRPWSTASATPNYNFRQNDKGFPKYLAIRPMVFWGSFLYDKYNKVHEDKTIKLHREDVTKWQVYL